VSELVKDLLKYIDKSPTPYHAVVQAIQRLEAAGYRRVTASTVWDFGPGHKGYVTRHEGSLIAFECGSEAPAQAGFRILGAHTDSPNLRLKPAVDVDAHGYRQLAVEPYGSLLLHTWLDRDLSVAGRATFRTEQGPRTELVAFGTPLVRIPSLAIHLNRDLNKDGLKLNPQQHSMPISGVRDIMSWRDLLAAQLRAQANPELGSQDLLSWDLMLYDLQPATLGGVREEFIQAPRLDNLASCHAAVGALTSTAKGLPGFTRAIVLYDHEEVGSRSASGASSNFLPEVLERVTMGYKGGEPQGFPRAISQSMLVSVDMAHAVHPNFADKHEPGHRPLLGRGPVIKSHASQAYATDAASAGHFTALCRHLDIDPQYFVSRSDLPCGSTIGPISAAQTGIRTVDVGNPMLSMHSCREMSGTADVEPMVKVLRQFLMT